MVNSKRCSSATNQCCFGRVVELEDTCCLDGLTVPEPQQCQCIPRPSWVQLETSRAVELVELIETMQNQIASAIGEEEDEAGAISDQIETLDQTASQLERKFYELIEVEHGDPEGLTIEREILNSMKIGGGENGNVRRRRFRRFTEEYIPDYMLMDAGPVYETEKGEYEVTEYEYEPEPEFEDAHIHQVKEIVMQREKLRGDIIKMATKKHALDAQIDALHALRMTVVSIEQPVAELHKSIDRLMELSVEAYAIKNDDSCDEQQWQTNIVAFLAILDGVVSDELWSLSALGQFDQLEQSTKTKIHRIQFWHERNERNQNIISSANFEEELEEYSQLDEGA